MEQLVALVDAAQNGDRVLYGRLGNENRLEAALKRLVFFDILAVLVERRRADAVQLAAREHGLEQVARVHRALGLASADDGVQLVDKQDDPALGLTNLFEHGLQPLFKLAAVLRARNQRAHVEGKDRPALQALGHVAFDNALRQRLDDGRLADARLTDQNGVVLRLAREDADDIADLLIAADDRIHLLASRLRDKIGSVFVERVIRLLGVVARHALAAAHRRQRLQADLFFQIIDVKQVADDRITRVKKRQENMLDGDKLVLHPGGELLGGREHIVDRAGDIILARLTAGPGHARQLLHLGMHRSVEALDRHAHLLDQLRNQALLLAQQRQQQMRLLDLLIVVAQRELLRALNRLQRPSGILFCIHHSKTPFRRSTQIGKHLALHRILVISTL